MAIAKKRTLEGIELARLCAGYADDKKAEDILILDVRGLSPMTDYYVVCTATSSPHLRAVRDEVADQMKVEHGVPALVSDGALESQWLVLGYSDVMVHVFTREKREFYALEDLWNDAPKIRFKR
jgi:ribosome-associated protein